jgi:hypothetical protein
MINSLKTCQLLMQTLIMLSKVSFYRYAIWHCWMRLRDSKMIIEKKLTEYLSDIKMGTEIQSLRLIRKSLIWCTLHTNPTIGRLVCLILSLRYPWITAFTKVRMELSPCLKPCKIKKIYWKINCKELNKAKGLIGGL